MTISLNKLSHFTGTEQHFRHELCPGVVYTDGVKYLADNGAAWLIDKIATNQKPLGNRDEDLQCWKLTVDDGHRATLTCTDGDYALLHSEQIDFTDFPLPEIDLWVEGNVILLPQEH